MPSEQPTPGLKIRRNRDGTQRLIWVARADLVKAGYTPKTVRLHYDPQNADDHALISSACQKLQAEMLAWSCDRKDQKPRFDGTVASLVRVYQTHEASPYKRLKWNTRRTYDQVLRNIERAFGKRVLAALTIEDFFRWYEEAKKPKKEGGPERVRKAHGIISMMRRLVDFGVMTELSGCERLSKILEKAEFKQPGRRREKLELEHVKSFISAAIQAGRISLALGTALQFETTLRQKDVIGEWSPVDKGEAPSGIILRKRRWERGLTWSDISADLLLHKVTSKTGAAVAHDLKLCPLFLDVLKHVPIAARVGPVILDEVAGRPYAEHAYAREWRIIAERAGIPKEVRNMDARAGGLSEADDAGAEIDEIRSTAGHSQISTTLRYIRGSIGKSRRVAKLRTQHREIKNEP